ncbi:Sodium-coupled monocarboxylate transporter 2 [Armadillidium vulgare]|nr:Sodium-coupled monocarboxylate transporter 2 [Armadillidium vulgare]
MHLDVELFYMLRPLLLHPITKLNILTNIFLLGTICTIYSAFGGIRAVVWTDVFQFSAMLIGLIAIVGVGIVENEGIVNILYTSSKGERLGLFNMSLSPFERYTFINTVSFGFFMFSQTYGTEQINLQRICAVKSIKNARR